MGLSEERWLQVEEESSRCKGPASRTHLECGNNSKEAREGQKRLQIVGQKSYLGSLE